MEIEIDKLIRSDRKTISLEMTRYGELVVHAPRFISMGEIQNIVNKKAEWVLKKRQQILKMNQRFPQWSSEVDGVLWFLGDSLHTQFSAQLQRPTVAEGMLILPEWCKENVDKVIKKWYREQARVVIEQRVRLYGKRAGLLYRSVGVNSAKTRWGSCGPKNTLNFSWRLIMTPMSVIDYVVVHELSHTRFHDHSSNFWRLVAKIKPDYFNQRQWLSENSGLLSLFP